MLKGFNYEVNSSLTVNGTQTLNEAVRFYILHKEINEKSLNKLEVFIHDKYGKLITNGDIQSEINNDKNNRR